MSDLASLKRVRVWDLPTRLFHILLALAVAGLIVTGEIGGNALQLHFKLGYVVLTLIFFRIIWGFVGGHWSRFVHFLPKPSQLISYALALRQQQAPKSIGHNPLGALSVFALLSFVLVQALSGMISDDEISNSGPWTPLVSSEWVSVATQYHGDIGKVILIVLIILHVSAVVFYKHVKHDDLITPMFTGDKVLPESTRHSRDSTTSRLFALSILMGCAYVVDRLVHLV